MSVRRVAISAWAGSWRWQRGLLGVVLSAAAVGLPTDVIDNPLFTRMTPVRWWEYPVLGVTVVLTGVWASIRQGGENTAGSGRVIGSSLLSALAVGCPVCNKIAVSLLGVSGALGVWAPAQPLIAVLSIVLLATAVVVRWRRRECTTETCSPVEA